MATGLHPRLSGLLAALLFLACSRPDSRLGEIPRGVPDSLIVDVRSALDRLAAEEDTDGDRRITIDDRPTGERGRGDEEFLLRLIDGEEIEVRRTYHLSNLLQELRAAQLEGWDTAVVAAGRVFEPPTARISRLIRERYWDALTRRVDAEHIEAVLRDEKIGLDGIPYLYVPYTDTTALRHFEKAAHSEGIPAFRLARLPRVITPEYVESLRGRHGLLTLGLERASSGEMVGIPFVVPGGRFNEMYGWDSYFEAVGLLEDGRVDLARAMVDNFVYQLRHYGKILNANRTYYLTRSQPPFLTSMALAVYDHLGGGDTARVWLAGVLEAAIAEYETVWTGPERLDSTTGLSRYFGQGMGQPPEVEPGHFDPTYAAFGAIYGIRPRALEELYAAARLPDSIQAELDEFFRNDRCMRESGHDTTYRWDVDGSRCTDFVTVDLNSLLYKIELDIARTVEREWADRLELSTGRVVSSSEWYERARRRRASIRRYLWDSNRSLFFDYSVRTGQRREYVAATTFYPLWASGAEDPALWLLSRAETERLVEVALRLLEMPGGLVSSTEASRGPLSSERPARQWDYPNGWAPHQMLAWRGLLNLGFVNPAQRLAYRWLYTITRNAVDYNGTIPEKYDVVARSHAVFGEYGNVGTEFEYLTPEGFGWMNASFQVGLSLLTSAQRRHLDRLDPPERLRWATGRDRVAAVP